MTPAPDLARIEPAFTASPSPRLEGPRPAVTVTAPQVRFGDLFETAALPGALRAVAANLVLARVPAGRSELVLKTQRVVERARALVPALTPYLPRESDGTSLVHVKVDRKTGTGSGDRQGPTSCVRAKAEISAASVVTSSQVVAGPCQGAPAATPFHYDPKRRTLLAARVIPEGELLAAPPAFALADVRPGQTIVLRARFGPVVVEREVKALQAGRASRPLFVAASDNAVFAARPSEIEP